MTHHHRNIDTDGTVDAGGDGGRVSNGVDVWVAHKQGDVAVRAVQFAFRSKGQNFVKNWSMRLRVCFQQVRPRGRRATESEVVDRCGASRFRLLFSLPVRKRVVFKATEVGKLRAITEAGFGNGEAVGLGRAVEPGFVAALAVVPGEGVAAAVAAVDAAAAARGGGCTRAQTGRGKLLAEVKALRAGVEALGAGFGAIGAGVERVKVGAGVLAGSARRCRAVELGRARSGSGGVSLS